MPPDDELHEDFVDREDKPDIDRFDDDEADDYWFWQRADALQWAAQEGGLNDGKPS